MRKGIPLKKIAISRQMYHREHGQLKGYERNLNVVQCE